MCDDGGCWLPMCVSASLKRPTGESQHKPETVKGVIGNGKYAGKEVQDIGHHPDRLRVTTLDLFVSVLYVCPSIWTCIPYCI